MANYVLLERIELNASAASVTFANIPQTGYTDLKVVVSARSDQSGIQAVNIAFNGSTANQTYRSIFGDGSSAASYSGTNPQIQYIPGTSQTANTFNNAEMYIPNYREATNKSFSIDQVQETNATTAYIVPLAGLWSNTAAITSLTFTPANGNLVANSTFSLYGIAALGTTPAIAPKASGGNVIATDGTYWYHAFLASGTFTPQVGLTADILQIAGGGGGGNGGGGGGAGGLLTYTSQALTTSTNYSCTVGSGGTTAGTNGSDSQFGSLTASVGGGGTSNSNNGAGLSGGSGGGGAGSNTGAGGGAGGAGTSGQGNAGGAGNNSNQAGGGGGAGAVGASANSGSAGGNGSSAYSSWGSATVTGQNVSGTYWYAGGGGGYRGGGATSSGGSGGGGGSQASGVGVSGTANTGGGAGGYGSSGGAGIIIVRYPIA